MLKIYTPVWGRYHFELWKSCVKSLLWPKNLAAIQAREAVWRIQTDVGTLRAVEDVASRLPIPVEITTSKGDFRGYTISAVKESVGHTILMAPADLIFGDGSIPTLLRLCELGKDRCIAAAHVRVRDPITSRLDEPKSNSELVWLAFQHMAQVFRDSRYPSPRTNSVYAGTAWTEIGEELYAASFCLPTVHVAQITQEDADWHETHRGPGAWDHEWPMELIRQNRYRLLGSSDAAFMAEVTTGHGVPTEVGIPGQWDRYRHEGGHFAINRNTVCVLRGSPC